jgi:AcrR family transcriptional regulator
MTENLSNSNLQFKSKLGRPRAGSEDERLAALLDHALKIFMRDGYGLASIGKIASAASVSTRTIYERYQNKADLLVASVAHMVERDVVQLRSVEGLDAMSLAEELCAFGEMIIERMISPQMTSFYRMGVAEAARFPELSSKIKTIGPYRIQGVIAEYLRLQVSRNRVQIEDVDQAAALFCHMLIAEPRHNALFGFLDENWDANAHIRNIVGTFLHGVSPNKKVK